MAKKIVMLDDLDDGKEADETLLYLVDGEYWEIDLAADNAEEFREAFGKYVRVSRPVAAKDAVRRIALNAGTPGTGAPYGNYDPAVVRAWALENDVEVGGKGRIPEHVLARWWSATQGANTPT